MKPKILALTLLCVIIVTTSTIPLISAAPSTIEIPAEIKEQLPTAGDKHLALIYGPLSGGYAEIQLLGGRPLQLLRLSNIINRKILQYLRPTTFLLVRDLNFTVTFKKDVTLLTSKYYYATNIMFNMSPGNKTSIEDTMHSVTVGGFKGLFVFMKPKKPLSLLQSKPPRFMFFGTCEHVSMVV